MFRLSVLQNQWLFLAMFGGLVLIAGVVLAYLAMWRGREAVVEEQKGIDTAGGRPAARPLRSFMPWFLILTYAFVVVFAVVYTVRMIVAPPNW